MKYVYFSNSNKQFLKCERKKIKLKSACISPRLTLELLFVSLRSTNKISRVILGEIKFHFITG